jgi:hypothetical protein
MARSDIAVIFDFATGEMFLFLDDYQTLSTEMRCFAKTAAHFDDGEARLLCSCPYKLNDIFIKKSNKF